MTSPSRRPRAVLLVANPAAPYSRGLRVARSLVDAGFDVEIAAVDDGRHPAEERDGDIEIRRYRPRGFWARWATDAPRPSPAGRLGRVRRAADAMVRLVAWPVHVRGWWASLRADLPPADLYHAFGILTAPVALDLATDTRRAGRECRVIYDVIDVTLESNNVARIPGPVLAVWRYRERRWVSRADAVVTVNDPIADHLARRWSLVRRPTVLLNCQPRWESPDPRPDLIRAAAGIPAARRIVLFLGRLGRERGLDSVAESVLALDDATLVLLGFGAWEERERSRDRDPRFEGRHVTLPAVHPDLVREWAASADVTVVAVPANSLNQRLSTPNKFWESLTAGTPILVGHDLEVMRAIVEGERVGAIADPDDPADIARALRELLDAPADERAAMRARCLRLARERYSWEAAVVPYLALVRTLQQRDGRPGV